MSELAGIKIASQLDIEFSELLLNTLSASETQSNVLIETIARGLYSQDINAEILLAAPSTWALEPPQGWPFDLKWIHLISSGIDAYPRWLFDGPVVTSSRGTTAIALAEFALALIFAAAKNIPEIWIHEPTQWQRQPLQTLAGQTLGIFGYGAIGQQLAKNAVALGMKVLVVRKTNQPIDMADVRVVPDIKALFAESDHVVLAAPATPDTQHIIDQEVLAAAKPNLHLVNIARGSLIDQDALLKSLNEGNIARASLDVVTPEPLPKGHPLYTHPRVFLSPHTSATVEGIYQRVAQQFAENFHKFKLDQPLDNVVDITRGY
ncbi:NAD(P)-dependent oxidoreductase [Aquirhabdus sp.]|uniref:NAD(P)-dependent oxidoreductase n=1 Tax=Aquirhabdus sp. TaxID=2824160 RepID=UPI00396CF18A